MNFKSFLKSLLNARYGERYYGEKNKHNEGPHLWRLKNLVGARIFSARKSKISAKGIAFNCKPVPGGKKHSA